MERVAITEKDGELSITTEPVPELNWRADLEKWLNDNGHDGAPLTFASDSDK